MLNRYFQANQSAAHERLQIFSNFIVKCEFEERLWFNLCKQNNS